MNPLPPRSNEHFSRGGSISIDIRAINALSRVLLDFFSPLLFPSSCLDPCLDFYVPESDVKAISGGGGIKKRSRAMEKKAALSRFDIIPALRHDRYSSPLLPRRPRHYSPRVERAHGFNNYRYRYRNERNWLLRQFQFAEQSEIK